MPPTTRAGRPQATSATEWFQIGCGCAVPDRRSPRRNGDPTRSEIAVGPSSWPNRPRMAPVPKASHQRKASGISREPPQDRHRRERAGIPALQTRCGVAMSIRPLPASSSVGPALQLRMAQHVTRERATSVRRTEASLLMTRSTDAADHTNNWPRSLRPPDVQVLRYSARASDWFRPPQAVRQRQTVGVERAEGMIVGIFHFVRFSHAGCA